MNEANLKAYWKNKQDIKKKPMHLHSKTFLMQKPNLPYKNTPILKRSILHDMQRHIYTIIE